MLLFLLCIGNLGHFTIFIKWTCFIHTSDIVCVCVCFASHSWDNSFKISSNGFNSLFFPLLLVPILCGNLFLLLFSINQRQQQQQRTFGMYRYSIEWERSEIVSPWICINIRIHISHERHCIKLWEKKETRQEWRIVFSFSFARIIITVEWANGFEKWIIGKSLAVYFLSMLLFLCLISYFFLGSFNKFFSMKM